ncbi:MAG: sigma 54-interacting transcriptional regulator [Desulfovibrionales bacterium]
MVEALGESDVFLDFQDRLSRVARVDRPILLVGERGTGKQLAATRLHYHSQRWQGPFVSLNCAALSPTLLESELFGHRAGAFTGALAQHKGIFEAADTGTLFLDEIGNMPLTLQEKILHTVEYGELKRVGSPTPLTVDVRVVAATNRDLPTMAADKEFLPDLLDRLSFEVLTLPPLRHRDGDLALLAEHFMGRMALELGMEEIPLLSGQARRQLLSYPWPGNVRELKSVVERAVFNCRGSEVTSLDLDPFASPYREAPARQHLPPGTEKGLPPREMETRASLDTPLADQVASLKLDLLRLALARARHNQKQAADLLGLTYHQFRNLYRKHREHLSG